MAKLTAIIMAAGMGTRMGELTKSTPKPLLPINNKPIIEYGINFIKQIGADEIIIVGGYQHDLLAEAVKSIDPTIKVIKNSSYELGNIFSLKAGLDELSSSSFLLYHADHIYRSELAHKIRNQLNDEIVLFTDNDRNLTDDDMKVKVADGNILRTVSKKISDFELGYVGITYCPEHHLEYYKNALGQVILDNGNQSVSENIMQYIADNCEVSIKIGDISGSKWHEVDNWEDYNMTKNAINSDPDKYLPIQNARCALCGSSDYETVCQYTGVKNKQTRKMDNVICNRCGLIFNNPILSDEYLADYYKNEFLDDQVSIDDYTDFLERSKNQPSPNIDKLVDFLSGYIKEDSDVLDIGCGFGKLLYQIKERYKCNVFGIEPDLTGNQSGTKKFLVEHVYNCTYDDFVKNNNKQFDFIILKMVLEHLNDPDRYLESFKSLLKPNGHIYIIIPNAYKFRPSKTLIENFLFGHIFSYTPFTIHQMLLKHGLKIVKYADNHVFNDFKIIATDVTNSEPALQFKAFKQGSNVNDVKKRLKNHDNYHKIFRVKKKLLRLFKKIWNK